MSEIDPPPGTHPSGPARRARTEAPRSGLRLPVWVWLLAWLALWVGGAVALHTARHGVVNGWHVALSTFLGINLLICTWELTLWRRMDDIRRWFHDRAGSPDRPRGSVFTARVSPRELFSTDLWARVWYEYAHWDDGYADPRSFGFAIDVGNGFSTLIPTLLFQAGMTWPIFSARVLGILGLLLFYQKLYGTVLYFFQFLYNRRHEGKPLSGLLAVVGGSNGIWLVFPLAGLYVCVRLVLENRFDVLWR